MALSHPSIQKLFREHFPGEEPLHLSPSEREAWIAEFKERFEGDEWIDTSEKRWVSQGRADRHLMTIRLRDPEHSFYSSDSFDLMLDEQNVVTIEGFSATAVVSRIDEVLAFVAECKRRLERQRALAKRREKVRGFKNAAMTAQIKEIAQEEGFDFVAKFTPQRITLWIRLDHKQDVLQLFIVPKRFPEALARLASVIRSLRESWKAGFKFKTVTRRALPWGSEWIRASGRREETGPTE